MNYSYYYFYDLNEVLIDRYPADIANQIRLNDSNSKFVFIFSERYQSDSPKNLPEGSKFYFIPKLNKKKLDQLVLNYPPKSLTTIAQRIPDMWLISFFNHKGIPTQIIQHGLWSDKLERIPIIPLLFKKFSKFINYLNHVKDLCHLNHIPIIQTLYELYHFLLKEDFNIPESKYLNNNLIRANKVFAFDSSWDDYYINKYGYTKNMLLYIGNPDFLLLKRKDIAIKEDSVCYLCQSLVEDGRISKDSYIDFLRILKSTVASKKKLYIKLHPRSKRIFYNELMNCSNIEFTDDLPVCEYYIAHYTGLLATVKQISNNILIWLLPNHHIPNYFINFGSVVTDSTDKLSEFISGNISLKEDNLTKRISKEELDNFDPIKIIANNLLHNSK